MGIILAWNQWIKGKGLFPNDTLGWVLLSIPITLVLSTLFGSILPNVSLATALFYGEPFIIYQYFRLFRPQISPRMIISVLASLLLIEGTITILQAIHGGPFGTILEYFPDYVPLDLATDATGTYAYRYGGTFPYANNLAHYLLFMLLILLPALFDSENSLWEEMMTACFIGVIAFILSLSRSAWAGFALGSLTFFYSVEHLLKKQIRIPGKVRLGSLIAVGCIVGVVS